MGNAIRRLNHSMPASNDIQSQRTTGASAPPGGLPWLTPDPFFNGSNPLRRKALPRTGAGAVNLIDASPGAPADGMDAARLLPAGNAPLKLRRTKSAVELPFRT